MWLSSSDVNLLTGSMMGGVFAVDGGATLVVAANRHRRAGDRGHPSTGRLAARQPARRQPAQHLGAAVIDVDRRADRVRVRLQGPIQLTAEITRRGRALGIRVGLELWAAVMATEIAVTLN